MNAKNKIKICIGIIVIVLLSIVLFLRYLHNKINPEIKRVSIVHLLINPDVFVGEIVEVNGFLTRDATVPYRLFLTKFQGYNDDIASSIVIGVDNENLVKHIDEKCVWHGVKVIGELLESKYVGYYLNITGIDLTEPVERAETDCSYNYYIENKING